MPSSDTVSTDLDFEPPHPIIIRILADERLRILRIGVTQIIPARAGPLRHRVRFAHRAAEYSTTLSRGPTAARRRGRLVIFQRRRQHRQRTFRQRFVIKISGGVLFPNDRERLAPVTLTAEQPVAQFVIDGFLAETFFFEPGGDFLFGFGGWKTIKEISEFAN